VTVLDQEPERQNILAANAWAFARRGKPVDEPFGRILHRRMFGQVWRWAGSYRASDKNIGVPYWEAPAKLRDALEAARYWIGHTSFPPDEIAVRFHHALVWIQPFPNRQWSLVPSDGRPTCGLARTAPSDLGRRRQREADEVRRDYIVGLRQADNHDFDALIAFARN